MVISKWGFIILFVFTVISPSASDDLITGVLKEITPKQAETILVAQNSARNYFIHVFTLIQSQIQHFDGYSNILETVIKGLQMRELDPLKLVKDRTFFRYNMEIPSLRQIAKVIYSMQGCNEATDFSIARWEAALKIIPGLTDHLMPVVHLDVGDLEYDIIDRLDRPFVNFALLAINHKYLNASLPLLHAILPEFRFTPYSADLVILVHNMKDRLAAGSNPALESELSLIRTVSAETSSSTLSRILSLILTHGNLEPQFAYQVNQLLSALKKRDEVSKVGISVADWLLAMRNDDYPDDVIEARNELMLMLKNDHLPGANLNVLHEELEGRAPTEKLLGLLAKLLVLPIENPAASKVHAIYPHVKMRYLANMEKYFVPESTSDIAFLLNSFLTVKNHINPSLMQQINDIFVSKSFDWDELFQKFDFSKYSKPRTLLKDILQLMRDSHKLPTCHVISIDLFLKSNADEGCSGKEHELLQLNGPTTPVITVLDNNLKNDAIAEAFKNCTEGDPVKVVNPECLIEIIDSKQHADFIIDLIRFNPIPIEKYPQDTRHAVFHAVLEDLKHNKYKDEVSDFVISQAILRLPLNGKANYPPTYMFLCPEEMKAAEQRAPPVYHNKEIITKAATCENIIEPNSLLEVIDPSYDGARIREVLYFQPILYEEYKHLQYREDVLKSVLENRKSALNNTDILEEISRFQASAQITPKGKLPPVIIDSCSGNKTVVEHAPVPSSDNVQDGLHEGTSTSTHTHTVDTQTLQSNTVSQPLAAEPLVGSTYDHDNRSNTEIQNQSYCSPNETLSAIIDSSSLLKAIEMHAPRARFIKNRIKSYVIPVVFGYNYTTAEVLRDVLDAIKEEVKSPRVTKNIEILKNYITDEGAGREPPGMIYACLPNSSFRDQHFRIEKCKEHACSPNETIVSVINTDSLFDALDPNSPKSSYVMDIVTTYIMPVDPSKMYKKGDVLRNVIQDIIKNGKDDAVLRDTLANIMTTGPAEMMPETVSVCFPRAYLGNTVTNSLRVHDLCMIHHTKELPSDTSLIQNDTFTLQIVASVANSAGEASVSVGASSATSLVQSPSPIPVHMAHESIPSAAPVSSAQQFPQILPTTNHAPSSYTPGLPASHQVPTVPLLQQVPDAVASVTTNAHESQVPLAVHPQLTEYPPKPQEPSPVSQPLPVVTAVANNSFVPDIPYSVSAAQPSFPSILPEIPITTTTSSPILSSAHAGQEVILFFPTPVTEVPSGAVTNPPQIPDNMVSQSSNLINSVHVASQSVAPPFQPSPTVSSPFVDSAAVAIGSVISSAANSAPENSSSSVLPTASTHMTIPPSHQPYPNSAPISEGVSALADASSAISQSPAQPPPPPTYPQLASEIIVPPTEPPSTASPSSSSSLQPNIAIAQTVGQSPSSGVEIIPPNSSVASSISIESARSTIPPYLSPIVNDSQDAAVVAMATKSTLPPPYVQAVTASSDNSAYAAAVAIDSTHTLFPSLPHPMVTLNDIPLENAAVAGTSIPMPSGPQLFPFMNILPVQPAVVTVHTSVGSQPLSQPNPTASNVPGNMVIPPSSELPLPSFYPSVAAAPAQSIAVAVDTSFPAQPLQPSPPMGTYSGVMITPNDAEKPQVPPNYPNMLQPQTQPIAIAVNTSFPAPLFQPPSITNNEASNIVIPASSMLPTISKTYTTEPPPAIESVAVAVVTSPPVPPAPPAAPIINIPSSVVMSSTSTVPPPPLIYPTVKPAPAQSVAVAVDSSTPPPPPPQIHTTMKPAPAESVAVAVDSSTPPPPPPPQIHTTVKPAPTESVAVAVDTSPPVPPAPPAAPIINIPSSIIMPSTSTVPPPPIIHPTFKPAPAESVAVAVDSSTPPPPPPPPPQIHTTVKPAPTESVAVAVVTSTPVPPAPPAAPIINIPSSIIMPSTSTVPPPPMIHPTFKPAPAESVAVAVVTSPPVPPAPPAAPIINIPSSIIMPSTSTVPPPPLIYPTVKPTPAQSVAVAVDSSTPPPPPPPPPQIHTTVKPAAAESVAVAVDTSPPVPPAPPAAPIINIPSSIIMPSTSTVPPPPLIYPTVKPAPAQSVAVAVDSSTPPPPPPQIHTTVKPAPAESVAVAVVTSPPVPPAPPAAPIINIPSSIIMPSTSTVPPPPLIYPTVKPTPAQSVAVAVDSSTPPPPPPPPPQIHTTVKPAAAESVAVAVDTSPPVPPAPPAAPIINIPSSIIMPSTSTVPPPPLIYPTVKPAPAQSVAVAVDLSTPPPPPPQIHTTVKPAPAESVAVAVVTSPPVPPAPPAAPIINIPSSVVMSSTSTVPPPPLIYPTVKPAPAQSVAVAVDSSTPPPPKPQIHTTVKPAAAESVAVAVDSSTPPPTPPQIHTTVKPAAAESVAAAVVTSPPVPPAPPAAPIINIPSSIIMPSTSTVPPPPLIYPTVKPAPAQSVAVAVDSSTPPPPPPQIHTTVKPAAAESVAVAVDTSPPVPPAPPAVPIINVPSSVVMSSTSTVPPPPLIYTTVKPAPAQSVAVAVDSSTPPPPPPPQIHTTVKPSPAQSVAVAVDSSTPSPPKPQIHTTVKPAAAESVAVAVDSSTPPPPPPQIHTTVKPAAAESVAVAVDSSTPPAQIHTTVKPAAAESVAVAVVTSPPVPPAPPAAPIINIPSSVVMSSTSTVPPPPLIYPTVNPAAAESVAVAVVTSPPVPPAPPAAPIINIPSSIIMPSTSTVPPPPLIYPTVKPAPAQSVAVAVDSSTPPPPPPQIHTTVKPAAAESVAVAVDSSTTPPPPLIYPTVKPAPAQSVAVAVDTLPLVPFDPPAAPITYIPSSKVMQITSTVPPPVLIYSTTKPAAAESVAVSSSASSPETSSPEVKPNTFPNSDSDVLGATEPTTVSAVISTHVPPTMDGFPGISQTLSVSSSYPNKNLTSASSLGQQASAMPVQQAQQQNIFPSNTNGAGSAASTGFQPLFLPEMPPPISPVAPQFVGLYEKEHSPVTSQMQESQTVRSADPTFSPLMERNENISFPSVSSSASSQDNPNINPPSIPAKVSRPTDSPTDEATLGVISNFSENPDSNFQQYATSSKAWPNIPPDSTKAYFEESQTVSGLDGSINSGLVAVGSGHIVTQPTPPGGFTEGEKITVSPTSLQGENRGLKPETQQGISQETGIEEQYNGPPGITTMRNVVADSNSGGDGPKVIQEATEIYYGTTEESEMANIVLNENFPNWDSSLGYILKPENSTLPEYYELLKWPILLKPEVNNSCYDQRNKLYTSPVLLINITSLFEVLRGSNVSELDEYLTATYLTSLDTYYKLYDFEFKNFAYKEEFLRNVLEFLLQTENRSEIIEPVKRIISQVPKINLNHLQLGALCNYRIFKELPKSGKHWNGVSITYVSLVPCQSGSVSYEIEMFTDEGFAQDLKRHIKTFSDFASREKIFENIQWNSIENQKDLAFILLDALRKSNSLVEDARRYLENYFETQLKSEKWKTTRPRMEQSCKTNMPDLYLG